MIIVIETAFEILSTVLGLMMVASSFFMKESLESTAKITGGVVLIFLGIVVHNVRTYRMAYKLNRIQNKQPIQQKPQPIKN